MKAPAAMKNDTIRFGTEGIVGAGTTGTLWVGARESLKSLKATILSSSDTIIQINLPIQTFFVPAGTIIFAKYPSSGVSKLIIEASSVSILASKSPLSNLSPEEICKE